MEDAVHVYIAVEAKNVDAILKTGYKSRRRRLPCCFDIQSAKKYNEVVLEVTGLGPDEIDLDSRQILKNRLQPGQLRIAKRSAKRFVWHDPHVNHAENREYLKKFTDEHAYDVRPFETVDATREFLVQQCLERQKWVVATSGKNGQDLVKSVEELSSVAGFMVLCANVDYHKSWAKTHPKVGEDNVLDNASDVIPKVQEMIDKHLAMTINIVVSAPTAYHSAIIMINRHFNGRDLPNGKKAHLYHMVITTGNHLEKEIDPSHGHWFHVWKGMVTGSLRLLMQLDDHNDSPMIVNMITLKGGPICDYEQKWLGEFGPKLKEAFDEIDFISLKHCQNLEEYAALFSELGEAPPLPDIPLPKSTKRSKGRPPRTPDKDGGGKRSPSKDAGERPPGTPDKDGSSSDDYSDYDSVPGKD